MLYLLILSVIQSLTTAQTPSSPCPQYFKYVVDGTGTQYGVIEVPPIQLGESLKINVQLSLRASTANVSFVSNHFHLDC